MKRLSDILGVRPQLDRGRKSRIRSWRRYSEARMGRKRPEGVRRGAGGGSAGARAERPETRATPTDARSVGATPRTPGFERRTPVERQPHLNARATPARRRVRRERSGSGPCLTARSKVLGENPSGGCQDGRDPTGSNPGRDGRRSPSRRPGERVPPEPVAEQDRESARAWGCGRLHFRSTFRSVR